VATGLTRKTRHRSQETRNWLWDSHRNLSTRFSTSVVSKRDVSPLWTDSNDAKDSRMMSDSLGDLLRSSKSIAVSSGILIPSATISVHRLRQGNTTSACSFLGAGVLTSSCRVKRSWHALNLASREKQV